MSAILWLIALAFWIVVGLCALGVVLLALVWLFKRVVKPLVKWADGLVERLIDHVIERRIQWQPLDRN